MQSIVIGIDPDADKHGIAIYRDGQLDDLCRLNTVGLVGLLSRYTGVMLLVSMEDVMANKFIYERNEKSTRAQQSKVAIAVGRCQQSQAELERWLDHLGVAYRKHAPQAGNWAKNKSYFERITGWRGLSNEDTRSAAYFGFLEAKREKRI